MKKNYRSEGILVMLTFIWGIGYPITSVALKSMGPFTNVSMRSLAAGIVLLIIFRKRLSNINIKIITSAFLISLSLVLGNIFQTAGMLYTTPSKSSFITGLSVIFVPIMVALVYKKRPEKSIVIGILVSLVGLLFLTYNGDKGINIGDILTLIAAILYSFLIILVDKFGKDYDGILIAVVEVIFVGILSAPVAIITEGYAVSFNSTVILAIVVTGVFGGGICMAIQNKTQPEINPTHASIIYLCEPVFGTIASVIIGDRLSATAIVGCVLILMAMFISSRGQ